MVERLRTLSVEPPKGSLTVECANAPWCLFRYISHGKALSRYRRTYLKSKAPLILGLKGLIRSWVNPASKVLINPLIFFHPVLARDK